MKKIYVLWQWLFVKNLKSVHIIHLGRPKMANLMWIILLSHHIFRIFLSLLISNDITLRKNHIIIVSRYLLLCSSRKKIDSKNIHFPLLLKSLTNNTELITKTSRLGYGVSYPQNYKKLLRKLHTQELIAMSMNKPLQVQSFFIFIYSSIPLNYKPTGIICKKRFL